MNTTRMPAYAVTALARANRLADTCNVRNAGKITYTVMEAIPHAPVATVAPNGSSRGTDYRTTVILRQDWANVPENGIYAGQSYRITDVYMSSFADGNGTISLHSSSQPWKN